MAYYQYIMEYHKSIMGYIMGILSISHMGTINMGTIVNMVTTINVGISYMDTINMWYIMVKIWLYDMDENIIPIMLHGAGILINIYPQNHPVFLPKTPKWFPSKIWNQQHHVPLPFVQPGTERRRNYEAGRCCDDYYLFKSSMFNVTIEIIYVSLLIQWSSRIIF